MTEEEVLDDWILQTLQYYDRPLVPHEFFTAAAIESKWGGDTPRLLASSNTCSANLIAGLNRLVARGLVRTGYDGIGRAYAYTASDPLEAFTRQVHE